MSKAKETMLFWAGIWSWAGAGRVSQCLGCRTRGGYPTASFPGKSRRIRAPAGGKPQGLGLTAKGNSLGLWPTWMEVPDWYSSSALQRALRIAVLITCLVEAKNVVKKSCFWQNALHITSFLCLALLQRVKESFLPAASAGPCLPPSSLPSTSRAASIAVPCPSCRAPTCQPLSILSRRSWMHPRPVVL